MVSLLPFFFSFNPPLCVHAIHLTVHVYVFATLPPKSQAASHVSFLPLISINVRCQHSLLRFGRRVGKQNEMDGGGGDGLV